MMDVGRAIEPAFRHMTEMLFKPFTLRMWIALGFVHLFAFGFNCTSIPSPSDLGGEGEESAQWLLQYWPLLVALAVLFVGLLLLLTWIASVLQFVYVNDIARKSGAVAEPLKCLKGLGTSYFLWQLAFLLIVLLVFFLVVLGPVLGVFALDWTSSQAAKVVSVVWAILSGLITIVVGNIVGVFSRDFVVPVMYARNVRVMEGWRIVLPILRANAGQSALYILMLMAISVAVGIAGLIVALLLLAVFAIPALALGGIGYLIGTALGLSWTPPVVAVAVSVGVVFLLAYVLAAQAAMQPAHVFRKAYSMAVIGQADATLATIPIGLPPSDELPPNSTSGE